MSLRDRIGVDLGRRLPLEDGIKWAAKNGIYYIDAQVDIDPNAFESFDEARCEGVREACEIMASIWGYTLCPLSMLRKFRPSCEKPPISI